MKNLFKNIWEAPAATISAALVATLTYAIAADIEWNKWILISLGGTSAFLSTFSGPNKVAK